MKPEWPSKPLAELCDFRNGLWKGKTPPYVHVGVIRNTNFTKSGFLDEGDIAYLDVEEAQFAKRQLRFGDLILEKSGGGPRQPVGRVITFEKSGGLFSFSNFTSVIRVVDPSVLSFRFLHRLLYWYYLSGVTEGMQHRSTGIRNLDLNSYKQLQIPLPPLPEQEQTVAILDEAFAAIATATDCATKNASNAREFFESSLRAVIDQRTSKWPRRRLGETCENLDSRRVPIARSKREPGSVPYYGASGVVDHVADHLFDEDLLLVSEDGANLLARTYPIAFSISGKSWVNNHAHVLRFGNPAVQRFVEFYLNSITLVPYVSGMAQPKLNQKALNSIPIPLSEDVSDVEQVVGLLETNKKQSDALFDAYQRKLSCLAELKLSMLHKAFTGELTADASAAHCAPSEAGL